MRLFFTCYNVTCYNVTVVCFRVFNIGIEVRQGRGRYCDTNIVTFTPRYQLDNQSSHKLAYAQRHFASQHVCTLDCTSVVHSVLFIIVSSKGIIQ